MSNPESTANYFCFKCFTMPILYAIHIFITLLTAETVTSLEMHNIRCLRELLVMVLIQLNCKWRRISHLNTTSTYNSEKILHFIYLLVYRYELCAAYKRV